MKLVEVEYLFEGGKAVFYFTAEGRVDFRQLVKELAHECRMRIEMRQIGVRDEARMIGGYGICGRELCCASFLSDFEPISIRMAKDQDLPLSPGEGLRGLRPPDVLPRLRGAGLRGVQARAAEASASGCACARASAGCASTTSSRTPSRSRSRAASR